jgi:adenylate cyclase
MGRQSQNKAVLFADVSQSGQLYQKLGDASARSVVNTCIEAMAAILPPHGGEVVKTLGDAILCVFPSADLAVLAAGEMQAIVTNTRPGNYPVAIHIGMHYGPVLYDKGDVFGDTVNVAAYLTAVATREQILTTEATKTALSAALQSSVRPIFNAVLKGSGRDSVVYQVMWKTDRADMTEVNLGANRSIPGDTGSFLVEHEGERVRIDQWRPSIRIGRGQECDLVVNDRYVSREHLTVKALRTRFYLIDHSINGTYVTLQGGEEVHILRGEMPLDRSGAMSLGRSGADNAGQIVTFEYDRRSMFRI